MHSADITGRMDIYITSIIFALGLAIGSFLNVVIYRVPRKEKIGRSRSRCTHCGQKLRWYHNIPLFSYIALRGKCAFCHKSISIRYPIVELSNALLYLYFLWQFDLTADFAVFSLLGSALLAIFFIDLDFQIIPDLITLPGIIAGLAISLIPGGIGIKASFIGLLVGGGSLYLVALLGDWVFKKESMGGGDIKMAAMLGAFLGWQKVLLIFISSAFIGAVVSVAILIFSARMRENRVVPFGPFLAAAAVLAMCYGDRIISYYLTQFVGLH